MAGIGGGGGPPPGSPLGGLGCSADPGVLQADTAACQRGALWLTVPGCHVKQVARPADPLLLRLPPPPLPPADSSDKASKGGIKREEEPEE